MLTLLFPMTEKAYFYVRQVISPRAPHLSKAQEKYVHPSTKANVKIVPTGISADRSYPTKPVLYMFQSHPMKKPKPSDLPRHGSINIWEESETG